RLVAGRKAFHDSADRRGNDIIPGIAVLIIASVIIVIRCMVYQYSSITYGHYIYKNANWRSYHHKAVVVGPVKHTPVISVGISTIINGFITGRNYGYHRISPR